VSNVLVITRPEGESDWKTIPKENYDLIIFTGGYFVSAYHSDQHLVTAFSDIVSFRLNNSNVVLLLNQDDIQYLNPSVSVPGFRSTGVFLFKSILKQYSHLLKYSYTYDGINYNSNYCNQLIPQSYYINGTHFSFSKDRSPLDLDYYPKNLQYNKINGYTVGVYTPYMENIDISILHAQRSVFNKFKININQIPWPEKAHAHPHSDFCNWIVDNEDVDFYVFFDIDAIPLKPNFLEILIDRASFTKLVGCEQTTEFISDVPFAAPSCLVFSKNLYNKMGRPRFNPTERSDDTQELTYIAWEQGIEVDFIKFTHCKVPNYYWVFQDGRVYGYGSVYEDLIYHNFQARFGRFLHFFIDECKSIVMKYS
jgi:hypothetical protein